MKKQNENSSKADESAQSAMSDTSPSATERLLQRYHDAELRPSERRELEERLRVDDKLRAQLERMEETAEFLAADAEAGEPAPLGIGFADRLISRLEAEPDLPDGDPGRAPFGQLSFKRWIAIAASFLVFLLAAHAVTLPLQEDVLSARERQTRQSRERAELLRRLDRKADEKEASRGLPSLPKSKEGAAGTGRK